MWTGEAGRSLSTLIVGLSGLIAVHWKTGEGVVALTSLLTPPSRLGFDSVNSKDQSMPRLRSD